MNTEKSELDIARDAMLQNKIELNGKTYFEWEDIERYVIAIIKDETK